MTTSNSKDNANNDEIDLIELIRHIWNGRWLIVKVTLAFMVLGLVIAFTTQEQYKAEARLLPEIKDTRGGASALLRQFGGLGALGGLSLPMGEGTDAIRPDLYPDVLKSTPFFSWLMAQEVDLRKKREEPVTSIFTYIDEEMKNSFWGKVGKYTIRLPWTLAKRSRKDNEEEVMIQTREEIPMMTIAQFQAAKTLRDRIRASIDQRSGIITISVEFPDRHVAAQIAQYSVEYLTEYITDYRTQKAQQDLAFTFGLYEEKKEEFHQTQLILARFRDANRNIVSAAAQTEEQRLQDQYNLAFNVYNGLAQQLEQARLKVQEETPVITVLEPVSVPVERSKPRRGMVMVIFTSLGLIFSLFYLIGHLIWKEQIKPFILKG